MVPPELDPRPDPDALLALAAREGEGRLKIFLGAAPGVGKTFAMLQAAQRLAAERNEVVLGLVETHARAETEALTQGLETLPRRRIDYRGQVLEEFDIDAALARRPRLIIVDELAHSNAPDCRHPKRWQDVKELLAAGIDVWTALNVQHLESLADVVTRITGVTVRETVPDTILQEAQDVVLVDITPDELIARLRAGKVYLPQAARRAIENFFTPANLTALREMALRRTADRVDDQVSQLLHQRAGGGPLASAERLLVCVGPAPGGERLVRQAARLATSLNASWIAVSLARPGQTADPRRDARISGLMTLAESLGADVRRLTSADFAADLLRLAARESVTQIIVGRGRKRRLAHLAGRSLPEAIQSGAIRSGAKDIAVLVVPLDAPTEGSGQGVAAWVRGPGLALDLAWAALATLAGIAVGLGLDAVMELPNLSMVFLGGVLACSLTRGTRAAVMAATLSFLGYNFFFIDPVYTLTVARPHELFALLVFLVVATLTGSLTGRERAQARAALAQTRAIEAQAAFASKLAAASTEEDVLWATVTQVHGLFGGRAVLLLPQEGELVVRAAWPPEELSDPSEITAARWALEKAEPAGWRTTTLPNLGLLFLPLTAAGRVVAVLGFAPRDNAIPLAPDEETRLQALAEQAAVALDRASLVQAAVKAAALEENEALRDALLASLSHDLRTPLAVMAGCVTTLQDQGPDLSSAQSQDLLLTIRQETERLTRFVGNLLDMSRIEQGAIKARRDWVDVGDAVRAAVDRCVRAHPGATPRISLARDLAFVRGDQDLLTQVLFNLLDNAVKYGEGSEVSVHARNAVDQVMISVTDAGPGIRPADLERIFEKFWRAGGTDRRKPGTGLGLSICRGLVRAMGGEITAESPAQRRRGTRLVIRLPAAPLPGEGQTP
ncbi:DUF4118 domain-containing protein [bacterium]|nr:DUF4118 domain-containing protein [bacterium]